MAHKENKYIGINKKTMFIIELIIIILINYSCNFNNNNNNSEANVNKDTFYKSKIDSSVITEMKYCNRGFVCLTLNINKNISFAAVVDDSLDSDFYSLADVGDCIIKDSNSFYIVLIKKKTKHKYNIFVGW